MKTFIITIIVIVAIAFGFYLFTKAPEGADMIVDEQATTTDEMATSTTDEGAQTEENPSSTTIGKSIEGRNISAYHYGSGDEEVLFVGGIHGGYEWNTVLVAYQMMDYLEANPSAVPSNLKVTVIPVLNPDGLNKVVGTAERFTISDVPPTLASTIPGRFNANNVDINRNFDCDWQASGVWQDKVVSGGSAAFSEPESRAIKNYIEANNPSAVIVWYSAAGGVFASNCHNGIPAETKTLTKIYSDASGYRAYDSYDFYATTGDMANWLAKNNIPAISILLTNHTDTEWTKNRAGIDAVLEYYAE